MYIYRSLRYNGKSTYAETVLHLGSMYTQSVRHTNDSRYIQCLHYTYHPNEFPTDTFSHFADGATFTSTSKIHLIEFHPVAQLPITITAPLQYNVTDDALQQSLNRPIQVAPALQRGM